LLGTAGARGVAGPRRALRSPESQGRSLDEHFAVTTISEALTAALTHHAAGRLPQAEQIYRQILDAEPRHADALHLLGVIAHQVGQHATAVDYIGRAIEIRPQVATYHNNLGEAYRAQGKSQQAETCYRCCLELDPRYAEAHNNLGVALEGQGRIEEAVACYQRALQVKSDYAEPHNNLGNVYKHQGRLDEAAACYRRSLQIKPDYAEALGNLGNLLSNLGRLEEALACYRQAIAAKPGLAELHNNQGNAWKAGGNFPEAIACYQRAIQLKPGYGEAFSNLADALAHQGQLDEATAYYQRAIELNPDYAVAYNNLGNVYKDQGRLEEARECYAEALRLDPDFVGAHDNALYLEQYRPEATLAGLKTLHAQWQQRHAEPLQATWRPHAGPRDRARPLRLGFVSADLGRHPVGYFLVRTLECLRGEGCETACYSDGLQEDNINARIRAASQIWRQSRGHGDPALASQIRADQIDVLFDLAGHTAHNRLLTFARKPAPVQVTWAGYVGTTGLKAMDYLLADRYQVPPGAERHYQERVLRMPDGYVCYDPPADAPPVMPLPSLERGQVTLGCFNYPGKITSHVVEVWARILRRLPGARLVLKYKGWDDRSVAGRLAEMFALHAIDPGRLELHGHSPHAELLAAYHRIDLALDPFPYSGGLTTCEALWMGVPIVTCPGETFASRHALSHLSNVGLTETIAHDLDEYVELVVSLAGDLPRLAALRGGLRQRMAVSPLCDGPRFARNLVELLRRAWRQQMDDAPQ
jgi:predicted O-linked N-acetylglucosamine transferase (SPINDLY family)